MPNNWKPLLRDSTCSRCLITHESAAEGDEMHAASDRIRQWLRERVRLILEPAAPLPKKGPNALSRDAQLEGK